MEPIVLFGIQFTLSFVAYALLAIWYAMPRLATLSRDAAVAALLWVHVFRVVGGTILAPGAVDPAIPDAFRTHVGYGDLLTAFLALLAVVALRLGFRSAIALVWLCLVVGTLDTINAIVESIRYQVFSYPLGINWVIVTSYVPALLVTSFLIFLELLGRLRGPTTDTSTDVVVARQRQGGTGREA